MGQPIPSNLTDASVIPATKQTLAFGFFAYGGARVRRLIQAPKQRTLFRPCDRA
jgi:hypothetical protein